VRDAGVVPHTAAQAGVGSSWVSDFHICTDNNVLATQPLLGAAKAEGVDRFVYASTSSVCSDTDVLPMREDTVCRPLSPYGVSKLAGRICATCIGATSDYRRWLRDSSPYVARTSGLTWDTTASSA
jgi:nucleoside-diphosphate-sugar epimerase